MKHLNILFAIGILSILCSCEKKDISTFTSDDAGIYFQYRSSYSSNGTEYYVDSIDYSFAAAKLTAKSTILSVDVRTLGKVVDYARPVRVVVDKERSTAVEGTHFNIDLDTLTIPAGESKARLRVRFLRTDDMLEKTVKLVLRLEENEYFKCYLDEYKNTSSYTTTGAQISATSFMFSVSEMYTEPSYWTSQAVGFFGKWTAKKYVVVNSVCELTPSDWSKGGYSGAKLQYGRLSFYARAVQAYLQEQADAGTPVVDSDGNFMELSASYPIDYSKYE